MHDTTDTAESDRLTAELENLSQALQRKTATQQRKLRWLCTYLETADIFEGYARQADAKASLELSSSQPGGGWHVLSIQYRRSAAIERAKADLVREHIGGLPPRSHIHAFTEELEPGDFRCACGQSAVAAETLDPDYVTACCGCPVGKLAGPIDPYSVEFCFACQRDRSALIHHDQRSQRRAATTN
ncbi:hypothetical protein ACW9HH_36045 [Nocardia gipuzkoensis]